MIDREKVIEAIENCIGQPKCKDCPWEDCEVEHEVVNRVPYGLMCDALALLKEQEPREPHYTTLAYIIDGTEMIVHHPECPRCIENGLALWDAEIERGQAYCKRCGQAVKWND